MRGLVGRAQLSIPLRGRATYNPVMTNESGDSQEPPEEWVVDWKSIDTPGDLLVLMCSQLQQHLNAAIRAGCVVVSERFDLTTVAPFLFSAAIVGDFFWPSPSRRGVYARAFPNRPRDMRHLVGIEDVEPANLDKVRNDLTHIDERLEELYLAGPQSPLYMWGPDNAGMPPETRRYMTFDASTGTVHSLGRDINARELVEWLDYVARRLAQVFPHLLRMAPDVGEPIGPTD